jgi:HAD superfamily hydrolase (TIGR01509 family)
MARAEPKAFLFDLDGVLVDSAAIVRRGWQQFASERGLEIPPEDYPRALFGRRTRDILIDYFGLHVSEADALIAGGLDNKTSLVAEAGGLSEIAGASAFVRSAKNHGLKLAVASSASRPNVMLALDSIRVRDLMDAVITSADVSVGKPAPDPYLAAARAVAVDPADAVVFEDTLYGIQSAHSAGARCVALTTTLPADQLAGADLVINDFRGVRLDRLLADLAG